MPYFEMLIDLIIEKMKAITQHSLSKLKHLLMHILALVYPLVKKH